MKRHGKSRRLSDEEVLLWRAVAATVEQRIGSILPARPESPASPVRMEGSRLEVMPPSPSPTTKPMHPRPVPPLADFDRRTRTGIARGRLAVERVIDLHGLGQADAHAALRRFLRSAHTEDRRLVLVVTGKGERRPSAAGPFVETGVLKRLVPHWLREIDLRNIVLGFEPAGATHGGSGALYVRLRRRRAQP